MKIRKRISATATCFDKGRFLSWKLESLKVKVGVWEESEKWKLYQHLQHCSLFKTFQQDGFFFYFSYQ